MNIAKAKIIASMGPAIEKETVLVKIANFVDGFRINLAHMNEDIIKKYIGAIEKIDSSKSIILDTKGQQVRTKNSENFELKKGEIFSVGFENCDLNIDYEIKEIETNQKIFFDNYKFSGEIVSFEPGKIFIQALENGEIKPNKTVIFENHEVKKEFLGFKDKKYILIGVRLGASIVALNAQDENDFEKLETFLEENNLKDTKTLIKIQHSKAIENFGLITQHALCDGLIIDLSVLKHIIKDNFETTIQNMIHQANIKGKLVLVSDNIEFDENENENLILSNANNNLNLGVDGFILTHQTSQSQNPTHEVQTLFTNLANYEIKKSFSLEDLKSINPISDYISYSILESIKFLKPKIIICPTEKGNMAARIASLKPCIPILAITKSQGILKYLNLLWGVKGFKISQDFDLENVRRISKEVIRNIFKGDINLDDKIIVVHSNLSTSGSANGISIYKFKDL